MPPRSKMVRAGDWRTLETFWNVTTTAFFRLPPAAEIKIRYAGFWFGVDRQRQTLDGQSVKKLSVSPWSVFAARLQIKVPSDVTVTYSVEPGNVAVLAPELRI